jgi:hypothetical protein
MVAALLYDLEPIKTAKPEIRNGRVWEEDVLRVLIRLRGCRRAAVQLSMSDIVAGCRASVSIDAPGPIA